MECVIGKEIPEEQRGGNKGRGFRYPEAEPGIHAQHWKQLLRLYKQQCA